MKTPLAKSALDDELTLVMSQVKDLEKTNAELEFKLNASALLIDSISTHRDSLVERLYVNQQFEYNFSSVRKGALIIGGACLLFSTGSFLGEDLILGSVTLFTAVCCLAMGWWRV